MSRLLFMLLFLYAITIGYGQQLPENLSLEEAISFALKNNPNLKTTEAEISASHGRYISTFWLPSPRLSFSYEAVPTGKSLGNFGERYIEISQSFDFPSSIILRNMRLSKETDIRKSEYERKTLETTLLVKRAYLICLAKAEKLKASEENLVIAKDFWQKAEVRLKVGEGTNLEFLTAQVEFSQAQNLFESAKNNLKNAYNQLAFALGLDNGQEIKNIKLNDILNFYPYDVKLEELQLELNNKNPLIQSASLNQAKASIEQKLAWSNALPNFDIAYFRETIGGNSGFYGVSIGISIPLWFMFNQRGQIQEASANLRSSEFTLKAIQNEAVLNVRNAVNNFENQNRQVMLFTKEIIPQSQEVYRTAKASYEAGEITYLEYLQAQQTLLNSKSSYIDSLLDYNFALVEIEEAFGRRLFTVESNESLEK